MSEMTAKNIFEVIKDNKSEISFDDLRKNRNNLLPRANLDKLIVEQRDVNPDNPINGVTTLSEFEDSDVEEILEKLENVAENKPTYLKDEENKSSFFGKLKSLFKK